MPPTRSFYITPHPNVDALSDDFSSVASDVSAYVDIQSEARAVLDAYRAAHDGKDDTPAFFDVVLDNLPKEGQITMMKELVSFKSDFKAIRNLRKFFTDAVLKAMKYASVYSKISPSPHSDFDPEIEELKGSIEPSTRNDQKALKAQCLRRDGFRCVLTGDVDIKSVGEGHTTADDHLLAETECSHVIPFALRKFNQDKATEVTWKATIWWALYRYFPKLRGAIGPESVNQPKNAMTLNLPMHANFGKYRFAFQPSFATPNRYHLHQFVDGRIGIPSIHTFTSADNSVPLPSEDFLRVHHSIAKMLHVSGIGARIEANWDEESWDRMPRGAAPDGSTNLSVLIEKRLLMNI